MISASAYETRLCRDYNARRVLGLASHDTKSSHGTRQQGDRGTETVSGVDEPCNVVAFGGVGREAQVRPTSGMSPETRGAEKSEDTGGWSTATSLGVTND